MVKAGAGLASLDFGLKDPKDSNSKCTALNNTKAKDQRPKTIF